MITIGCFELNQLTTELDLSDNRNRWEAMNTLCRFRHITYGSQDDVIAQLQKQSDIWIQKFQNEELNVPKEIGWKWKEKFKSSYEERKLQDEGSKPSSLV